MNSFNDYGLGPVGDWLCRTVGGLAPATPGYRQLRIAPNPDGVAPHRVRGERLRRAPDRHDADPEGARR
ncbi:hypothetical protein [Actinoplanes sp. NPDC051411]|uniref:hypothetical protein n=1 Tax=Actinoplanes sp. NPDC051411 TaxID=3155522 RepID=UPI003431C1DF